MIGTILLCSGLLAFVAAGADAPPLEGEPAIDAGAKAEAEANQAAALAEYNARREQTAMTAGAQWRLALWCEKTGLSAEAKAHLANVVRLDPGHEAAWRKLGFEKQGGRWLSRDEVRDAAEQQKADREYGRLLSRCHEFIHGGPRRDEAEAELARIEDPRAVPSIYREFGRRGQTDQLIAVRLLGQVRSPSSSKTLAFLSIYGASPVVRGQAIEVLRGRDPGEYLASLVGLLGDPLEYEVRPVGGPGSPGVLFVSGERYNVRRFYAAPVPPRVMIQPGDLVDYDAFGTPIVLRPGPALTGVLTGIGVGADGKPTLRELQVRTVTRISPRRNAIEARRAAANAQGQLERDIAEVERLNRAVEASNRRVREVIQDASGIDEGPDRSSWKGWLARQRGYANRAEQSPRKPTLDQLIPPSYVPRFGESMAFLAKPVAPPH